MPSLEGQEAGRRCHSDPLHRKMTEMPLQSIRAFLAHQTRTLRGVHSTSLRRKEITWQFQKCHPKQKLRRHVPTAEQKWSLSVSNQFCLVGNSRISLSHARSAVLRKSSGSNAFDDVGLYGSSPAIQGSGGGNGSRLAAEAKSPAGQECYRSLAQHWGELAAAMERLNRECGSEEDQSSSHAATGLRV